MSSTADRVVQHVREHARCPHCHAAYRVEDIHVLGQLGHRIWDMAVVCSECYALSMLRAVVAAPDAPARSPDSEPDDPPAALDERSDVERLRLEGLGPIAPSDVRDAAAFLDGFDGDLRDWLARGSGA